VSGRFAPGAFVLLLVMAAASAFADTAAPPQSPAPAAQAGKKSADSKSPDAKPADLKEARSRLAAAVSPAEYAAMLGEFSTSLPPSDALALLDQGIAGAASEYRKAFLVKAADLDLLLGLFGEAAERYEAAASSPAANKASSSSPAGGTDALLILRAARCSIAAGDAEKAQALSADIIVTAEDPDLVAAARLVGAWALLMQDRPDDASALASTIAGAEKGSPAYPGAEKRREARFLIWLCAKTEGKAAAAAKLASEFPGSPEALIAAGSASAPPLPHWYLGGLGAARTTAAPRGAPPQNAASASPTATSPAPSIPASAPTATSPAPSAPASAPATKSKRLQIGYFSREDNAQALKAELSSKGFAAVIETHIRAVGAGAPAEKRWIVVVDGGKDPSATRQSLKDAGYESYVID
jgi:hypothetical protein